MLPAETQSQKTYSTSLSEDFLLGGLTEAQKAYVVKHLFPKL
jgi:hypothetical protein